MTILGSKLRSAILLVAFTSVASSLSAQTSPTQKQAFFSNKPHQQQAAEDPSLEKQAAQTSSEPPGQSPAVPKSSSTPARQETAPKVDPAKDQNLDRDKEKDPQNTGVSPASGSNWQGRQTTRILWIFPNYPSVSANAHLPALSVKQKFWLATQDSYSSIILAAVVAGLGEAQKQYPEFHHGAAGYGRYFWRAFVDQAVGAYFTQGILPTITHEDPRYYTRGQGGFFRRAGYAVSRLVVTRTDQGGRSFNVSEFAGNAAAAGISNLYYPSRERTFPKTATKWVTLIALDGLFNIFKEFWPDINHKLFHSKD
jgi:hypothetical protein